MDNITLFVLVLDALWKRQGTERVAPRHPQPKTDLFVETDENLPRDSLSELCFVGFRHGFFVTRTGTQWLG